MCFAVFDSSSSRRHRLIFFGTRDEVSTMFENVEERTSTCYPGGANEYQVRLEKAKVPKALLPNGQATDANGEPLCFGYSLGTCPHANVQAGQKCPKGWHKCCFKGCSANHPMKGNH